MEVSRLFLKQIVDVVVVYLDVGDKDGIVVILIHRADSIGVWDADEVGWIFLRWSPVGSNHYISIYSEI